MSFSIGRGWMRSGRASGEEPAELAAGLRRRVSRASRVFGELEPG
jgi:hypothetical protein